MEMSDGLPQSLEQVRQKLQQLTTSLQSLHYRIGTTPVDEALPPWPTIGSSLKVIATQLASLTDALRVSSSSSSSSSKDNESSIVVHPSHHFPIDTHEGLLTTLVRTRGLPETEAWQGTALAAGNTAHPFPALSFAQNDDDDDDEDDVVEGKLDLYTASEWLAAQRDRRLWQGSYHTARETDANFKIDRDDVDDLRRARQQDGERARAEMGLMLRFARRGQ